MSNLEEAQLEVLKIGVTKSAHGALVKVIRSNPLRDLTIYSQSAAELVKPLTPPLKNHPTLETVTIVCEDNRDRARQKKFVGAIGKSPKLRFVDLWDYCDSNVS